MNTLEQMNTRLFLLIIEQEIREFLKPFESNLNSKALLSMEEEGIREYMQSLKDREAIQNFSIGGHLRLRGWKELYPKLSDRLLARFGSWIAKHFKIMNWVEDRPRIWHHIFPYSKKLYVESHYKDLVLGWYEHNHPEVDDMVFSNVFEAAEEYFEFENLDMCWYSDWLSKNPPEVEYVARLEIPYTYLEYDLYIQPTRAIERINLNFKVGKE